MVVPPKNRARKSSRTTSPAGSKNAEALGSRRPLPARHLVRELTEIRMRYGDSDVSRRKREILDALSRARIRSKRDLVLFHESLLFLRAYPDSLEVMHAAEAGLRSFARRPRELDRGRRGALDETGVAGSVIHCAFSLPVVRDLLSRYRSSVSLFADRGDQDGRLGEVLFHLLSPGELEAYADGYLRASDWLSTSAGKKGSSLLQRLIALLDGAEGGSSTRRAVWAALELPIRWDLRDEDGSRTLARVPASEPWWQSRPFSKERVDLQRFVKTPPHSARRAAASDAVRWIDAARSSVASRLREMHTFMHANAGDVWVAPLEDGLEIGFFGVVPRARLPLRTFYGYLLARNGIPIGYGDVVLSFEWGELNFHVFDTFRQAASSRAYASIVRLFHHHFGLSYLFLNRYQFGHRNEDAIRSGAFWFYSKLGFRPRAPGLVSLWARECRKIGVSPKHRTSARDLRRLASDHMALALGPKELETRYAGFHPTNVGVAFARRIEIEAAGDRRAFLAGALRRVERKLAASFRGVEREALELLAPLLDCVPDLEEWPAPDVRALVDLVRAKAGLSELEFLRLLQANHRLRAVLVTLGSSGDRESTKRDEGSTRIE